MKFIKLVVAVLLMAFAVASFAQTYPYSNPSYTPNVRMSTLTVVSNVAASPAVLNSIGVVAVQFSGTCTALNARLEGSNDGTNYVTLNMYANGALTTASAVTSATATGIWSANTTGLSQVRVNNSGVTGSACTATLVGTPGVGFTLPH